MDNNVDEKMWLFLSNQICHNVTAIFVALILCLKHIFQVSNISTFPLTRLTLSYLAYTFSQMVLVYLRSKNIWEIFLLLHGTLHTSLAHYILFSDGYPMLVLHFLIPAKEMLGL